MLFFCGGLFFVFGDLVFEVVGGFVLVVLEGRGVVVVGVVVVVGKDRGEGVGGYGRVGFVVVVGDGGGVIVVVGRWWELEVRFGFGGDVDFG